MNEGQSNQPRSGGIEVSPGREPRVWMGRTPSRVVAAPIAKQSLLP